MNESAEQQLLVDWFRTKFPLELIFAIPNGGLRDKLTGEKMKLEGVVPGIPDLFIPDRLLFIEMKAAIGKKGRVGAAQRGVIEHINANTPCRAVVCYGFEQAKVAVMDWRSIRNIRTPPKPF